MKHLSLITLSLLASAASAQTVYNLFDATDLDADGWLWLDSQAKIDKYVGADKLIRLIDTENEIDDPDFPGEKITPATEVSPEFKGYDQAGQLGSSDSWTGGILLPEGERGWLGFLGGGFYLQLPDCHTFAIATSCISPNVYFEVYMAKSAAEPADCKYIWNYDDPTEWVPEDAPFIESYQGKGNIEHLWYDMNFTGGEGPDADVWKIQSVPEEPRTVAVYSITEAGPVYIHGLKIETYSKVNNDGNEEEGIETLSSSATEVKYYDLLGNRVINPIKGLYIKVQGKKSVKTIL